jgi:cold shock protein
MPQGTVKFFSQAKGYGFIAPDEGGGDVYVHANDVRKSGLTILSPGQKVTFDVELDTKSGRPRAVNVHEAQ